MKDIYHLIYISEAKHSFSEQEMEELMKVSQRNNKTVEVTGLLVAKGKVFLQLLEGAKTSVKHIYKKIILDERHVACEILSETTSHRRLFPTWRMGLLSGSDLEKKSSEILQFLKDQSLSANLNSNDGNKTALRILSSFSQNNGSSESL